MSATTFNLGVVQGGVGGLRQTFVDFCLGVPPCHQTRAGSGKAILESTKVCRRLPAPPCKSTGSKSEAGRVIEVTQSVTDLQLVRLDEAAVVGVVAAP